MKNIFYLIGVFLLLIACNETNTTTNDTENIDTKNGGELVLPLDSYYTPEKPTEVIKIEGAQINGQILESLVKYNTKTLAVEPALAESWSISEDGLTYTFNIRQGVKFHDNSCFKDGKGRIMTEQDIVDMFYRVYTNTPKNVGYAMFQNTIVGGDEFFNGDSINISGITINGNSVVVNLKEQTNTFLSKLVTIFGSIVPKEAYKSDGWEVIGTGPFVYNKKESKSELVVLDKNPDYWMKDSLGVQLPYLTKLSYKFYDADNDRMDDFWNGKIGFVKNVPITKVSEVLEERISDFQGKNAKYVLESIPQMATTFIEFNMESKIMKNVKVRKAISLAIDRNKLVVKTLKNQAFEAGKFGITPPLPKIYKNYDFNGIESVGYTRNSMLAKQLLAEAGYPNGKGFPTISAQFKMDNSRYLVMSEIQSQLKSVLNINLDIEQVEFNQLLENNAMGTTDIFYNIWIGDFTSPESFLIKFYGGVVPKDKNTPSNLNTARYVNPKFDDMFEKGKKAINTEEANKIFAEAEKILMQDPPFAVLFYGENLWLVQSNVKNFQTNGMNYIDFTSVYIDNSKKQETTKSH